MATKKGAADPASDATDTKETPNMEPSNPGTELVPADSNFAVVAATSRGESIASVLAENTGAGGVNEFDLDRVTIPPGGITSWSVPTLEGEEMVPEIQGIVVAWREPRAWWEQSLDATGGGTQPDCSSKESVDGHPVDLELAKKYRIPVHADGIAPCASCPLGQFGSDPREDSNAQWCKQRRLLFVIRESDYLPLVVSLAPGSLKAINKFNLRLSSQSVPYYGVVTSLKLEKVKSGSGIDYARVMPSVVRRLDPPEVLAVKEYASALRGAFDAITITQEEAAQ